jgi:hypothetical protein
MTFEEAYSALEDDFRQRVEEDKQSGVKCIFLPNVEPIGPVDYVLVGMEPSLGRWARGKGKSRLEDAQKRIDQGFRNFCGVWILHNPVRTYLCQDGESYYVTDLAKGAMLTNEKSAGSEKKYDEWYPLLEKELGLVAKPDAKIISIGNMVGQFLSKKGLYGHVGTIPHYSGRAARYWGKEIEGTKRKSEYKQFAARIQAISGCSCSPNRGCERDAEPVKATPTEPQRRLLFDYKVRFERIRDQDKSGWRHWQREWERRMTSA